MTWRDRLAQARARGHFTAEDERAIERLRTCPAAEVSTQTFGRAVTQRYIYGLTFTDMGPIAGMGHLWTIGTKRAYPALMRDDFDAFARALDAIEDWARSLVSTREGQRAP